MSVLNETNDGLKEKVRVEEPKKWKVIMHNDDYTTMEFVVDVIMNIFNKSPHMYWRLRIDIYSIIEWV